MKKTLFRIAIGLGVMITPIVAFAAFNTPGFGGGGGSTPGGSANQIQYNAAGTFGGTSSPTVTSITTTGTADAGFTNQFNGNLNIGTAAPLQANGLGTGLYQFQISSSSNDIVGGNIINTSAGVKAGSGIFFANDLTPLISPSIAATYYGGMAFSNSNWNGPALGLGALPPNSLAVYATDGHLVLGSATSTGSVDFYVGAGSFAGGVQDMILKPDASTEGRLGISTSSPSALLAISNLVTSLPNIPLLTIASTTGGTATTTAFTVLANGNVGVGTTSPFTNLSVKGGVVAGTYDATTSTGYTLAGGNSALLPQPNGGGFDTRITSASSFNIQLWGNGGNINAYPNNGLFRVINQPENLVLFSVNGSTNVISSQATAFGIATTAPSQLFAIGSTTSATTDVFSVDSAGNIYTGGGKPSVSGGGNSLSANAHDMGGIIYISGSQTSFTLTFYQAKPWAPNCVVSDNVTTGNYDGSTTPTTIVFATAASLGTASVTYKCTL